MKHQIITKVNHFPDNTNFPTFPFTCRNNRYELFVNTNGKECHTPYSSVGGVLISLP